MKRGNGEEAESGHAGARVADAPGEEARGLTPAAPTPERGSGGGELDALGAERDDLKDRLLRKTADFENFRKRVERDRAQAGREATAAVLKALIPTLDNLDHALDAEGGEGALRAGVELTRRELLAVLESRGVVVEDPAGQKFDPARHQALAHEPAPGFADGDVVQVMRKGYSHEDRLLRPALVKVAKGEDAADEEATDKVH